MATDTTTEQPLHACFGGLACCLTAHANRLREDITAAGPRSHNLLRQIADELDSIADVLRGNAHGR